MSGQAKGENPQRRIRELEKALKELVASIEWYLSQLDETMKQPPSEARGRKIAALTNQLDIAKDLARFGALNIDFRTGKRRK